MMSIALATIESSVEDACRKKGLRYVSFIDILSLYLANRENRIA